MYAAREGLDGAVRVLIGAGADREKKTRWMRDAL
jgi:UDP-N-acetylmuramyl tripeptide synthase